MIVVKRMNLMNNEKHYNTIHNYYIHKFGTKVYKIPLMVGSHVQTLMARLQPVAALFVRIWVVVILQEINEILSKNNLIQFNE